MTCLLTSLSNSSNTTHSRPSLKITKTHGQNQHFKHNREKMKTSIPMCFNNSEFPLMYVLFSSYSLPTNCYHPCCYWTVQ